LAPDIRQALEFLEMNNFRELVNMAMNYEQEKINQEQRKNKGKRPANFPHQNNQQANRKKPYQNSFPSQPSQPQTKETATAMPEP